MELTLLGLVVVLVVAWLFLRNRGQGDEAQTQSTLTDTGAAAYHAVSIKFDEKACEAARAMSGRRFLSSAAPRLPLPECDALDCRCRFVHHKDRRTGKDRRSPFAAAGYGGGTGSFEKERREKTGRRRDDADPDDF